MLTNLPSFLQITLSNILVLGFLVFLLFGWSARLCGREIKMRNTLRMKTRENLTLSVLILMLELGLIGLLILVALATYNAKAPLGGQLVIFLQGAVGLQTAGLLMQVGVLITLTRQTRQTKTG